MMTELEKLFDGAADFSALNSRGRCVAHIINLAVQAALSTLKAGEAKDEDQLLMDVDETKQDNALGALPKVSIQNAP
jgi:hypothetical protein